MQSACARSILGLMTLLVFSSVAVAQTPDARTPQARRGGHRVYEHHWQTFYWRRARPINRAAVALGESRHHGRARD